MKKNLAVAFLIFSMVFISCDQDFNTIGADLVGEEHFDFDEYVVEGLKAYSVQTGEVQTNNLPINPLGFYDNTYFGKTKANFVTQVSLATIQPKFGTSVQVENVTLYIPYFSKVKTVNSDGSREYTLDSIYSKTEADKISKMKLNVYENGYYLNSFDPDNNFQTSQRYYSDMNNIIDAQKKGHDGSGTPGGSFVLNDSPNNAENDQFFFNKAEIVVYKKKFNTVSGELEFVDENDVVTTDPAKYVVKERLAPGIYLTLNKTFFKKKILEAAASDLYNNNAFRQYFKGLYFKMEQVAGQEGAMAMLNFSNAKLNVNYSSINEGATGAAAVPTSKTFGLNLGVHSVNDKGNTISLQDYNYSGAGYTNDLSNSVSFPNSKLFLKGGKGSVVYMDVFGDTDVKQIVNGVLVPGANQIPDELEELRLKGWLINDAYLEFYIDKTAMAGADQDEAERLYLFDATNQKALADYSFDSSVSSNQKRNKFVYGGIIERDDTDDKGVKYKIRITQHINNLINSKNANLNKNVRLGLCVTENIALTDNYYYKTPVALPSGTNIEYFPAASIMAQQGVVLHGTNPAAAADAGKKLKLTIHFTKPN